MIARSTIQWSGRQRRALDIGRSLRCDTDSNPDARLRLHARRNCAASGFIFSPYKDVTVDANWNTGEQQTSSNRHQRSGHRRNAEQDCSLGICHGHLRFRNLGWHHAGSWKPRTFRSSPAPARTTSSAPAARTGPFDCPSSFGVRVLHPDLLLGQYDGRRFRHRSSAKRKRSLTI